MKVRTISLLKLLYVFILLVGSVYALSAQTSIYYEDFNGYGNGTTSSATFSTDVSGCNLSNSSDYFQVHGNKFEARDIDCNARWLSSVIDISDYDDVAVTVDLQEAGNMEWDDYMEVLYILDGGSEVRFDDNGYLNDDWNNEEATQTGLNGSTLQIVVIVNNDNGSEKHRIIDVSVEGTYNPAPTGSIVDIYSEDFDYSNGTTSASGFSINTSGCNGSADFEVNNGRWHASYTSCDALWLSDEIDISSYSNISLSADIEGTGDMESSDKLILFYIVDGGSETNWDTYGYNEDAFSEREASHTGINGSTLRIGFKARVSYSNEHYYIDNLLIQGTGSGSGSGSGSGGSSYTATSTSTESCYGSSTGSIDLEVSGGSGGGGNSGCSSSASSPNTCTGCSRIISGSGNEYINSGVVCIPEGQVYSGGLTMAGGTLVICGTAQISWINFYGGTIINNGTYTGSGMQINSSGVMKNYGTLQLSSNLQVNNEFENHGNMFVSGNIAVNSSASLVNSGTAAISGYLEANNDVENTGTINISNYLTVNSSGELTNECTINVTGNVTLNGPLTNNGTLSSGAKLTINSSGILTMSPGSLAEADDLTLNGDIANSGSGCASVEIADRTVINGSGEIGSNIDLCDADGIETNWGTINGTSNCSCNATGSGSGSGSGSSSASYTYVWSNGDTSQDLSNVAAGIYTVTISNGSSTVTHTDTVESAAQISLSATPTDVGCAGGSNGSINLSVTNGQSPYTYAWSNTETTEDISNLSVGVYFVTVTDDNGCTASTNAIVLQPDSLSLSLVGSEETVAGEADGEVNLTVSGGTSPYSYNWSNGGTTEDITGLAGGTYTVTVTDDSGCSATGQVVVATLNSSVAGLSGYCYRLPVVIQGSKVAGSGSHTDFPVYVNISNSVLKTTGNGGKVESNDGYDIVFTAEDGTTELDYQLYSYDGTDGDVEAWVRVPSLSTSSNTTIYLYYGNESVSTDGSSTGTWHSGYKAVLHLDENLPVNEDIFDATANGTHGEKKGSTHGYGYLDGKLGKAYNLDGVNDYYEFSQDLNTWLGGTASLSAWIKTSESGDDIPWRAPGITGYEVDGGQNDIFWGMIDGDGGVYAQAGDGNSANSTTAVNNNTWKYVTITRHASSGQFKVYVNGQLEGTAYSESGTKTSSFYNIGRVEDSNGSHHFFDGQIDEVHILNEILDAGWIMTEYNNQNSPSTFYQVGSEESLNCDDPSTASNTISSGSFIIDMGVLPQTIENGVMPYGLVYDLLANYQVPIKWVINETKAKDGVDFDHNGRSYSGGPFIVDASYRNAQVDSVVAHWESEGVEIDTTVSALELPVYKTLNGFSTLVIDEDNENLVTPYFDNAGIPTSVYTVGLPADLETCDELYVLPHADPSWADHGPLYQFVRNGGYIWSGCHAVSVLEGLYNPSNPSQKMNFLTTSGMQCYKSNKCGSHINESHGSPTSPYTYDSDYDNHPVMQFMGDLTPSTENGSEKMYIPLSTGGWNPNASRSITTSDGSSPNEGVKLVFGYAYDDTSNGMVMYEAGHTFHNKGSEASQVAAQRAFFNFYLLASTQTALNITATAPSTTFTNGTTNSFSVSVSGGSAPFSYEWTSTIGGSFSSTNSASTSFTASNIVGNVHGQIICTVTDACGKVSISSIPVDATGPDVETACTWIGGTSSSWVTGSNWSCGEVPTCADSVVIPSGTDHTPTITSGNTGYAKHLNVLNGATIQFGSTGALNICGNLYNAGDMNYNNGTISFVGSEPQHFMSTGRPEWNNVVINNTSDSGLILLNSIEIDGTLALEDGYLITGTDTVFLTNTDGNDETITTWSDTSFIVGRLNRRITMNSDRYIFPVGKHVGATGLYWVEIKNKQMLGVSDITVYFTDLARHNDNDLSFTDQDITYTKLRPEGMWVIEPNSQPLLGKYDIEVDLQNFPNLQDNNFGLLKRPRGGLGSAWNNGNGSKGLLGSLMRLANSGKTSLNNLTSFSEFGVGEGAGSSLPIQLTSFTAEYKSDNGVVEIAWETQVEINNETFEVQRSIDGLNYEVVTTEPGAGNSSIPLSYEAEDSDPPVGLVYYRLKQIDYDGNYSYSDMVPVMVHSRHVSTTVKLYPNPAKDHIIIELTSEAPEVSIMVHNMAGNLVHVAQGENPGQFRTKIDISSMLPSGQYLVRIKAGMDEKIVKLIVAH